MNPFVKLKKMGQAKAGAGHNQHVNKYQKRVGNKVIRRELANDVEDKTAPVKPHKKNKKKWCGGHEGREHDFSRKVEEPVCSMMVCSKCGRKNWDSVVWGRSWER